MAVEGEDSVGQRPPCNDSSSDHRRRSPPCPPSLPEEPQSTGTRLIRWKGPSYVTVYEGVPRSGPPSCVSNGGYLRGHRSAQIGGNQTALVVVPVPSAGQAGPTWLVTCGAPGREELRVSQEGAASALAARLPSDS